MRQVQMFIILSQLFSLLTGYVQPITNNFQIKRNEPSDPDALKICLLQDKYGLKTLQNFDIINIGNDPRDFEFS
ncbi:hypothetical protein OQX63_19025 [Pedobacter sp. PF22-3]|uniref:hypothetical protein n=1 Tax=Pedobacter sp. PF22-3 TaxID=2994467 RepID=UPI002245F235|nr:hypothetical protein [Pedobacter sp. PF22-3]MCX2495593.1 hypothetical protein [Pedobacter sp. PF22-3]